jgi:transcriptional regulator with XRE-family HTH domain
MVRTNRPVDSGRLAYALAQSTLTQVVIARRAGITAKRLAALKSGHNKSMPAKARERLARILQCSVRWLGGEPVEPPGWWSIVVAAMDFRGAVAGDRQLDSVEYQAALTEAEIQRATPRSGPERIARGAAVMHLLELRRWRALLAAKQDAQMVTDDERHRFAILIREAVTILVAPWPLDGERIPQAGQELTAFLLAAFDEAEKRLRALPRPERT